MYLTKITEKNIRDFKPYIEGETSFLSSLPGAGVMNDEGEEIGAVIVDTDGIGLLIRSLFVDPLYRNQGAGSLLLKGACDMARICGVSYVDAFFYDRKDGTEDFFLENGFLVSKGFPIYSIPLKNAYASSEFRNFSTISKNCICLEMLDEKQRERLGMFLREANYQGLELFAEGDLSFVYFDDTGRILTCLLAGQTEEEDTLRVELILNRDHDNPQNIMELIRAFGIVVRVEFSEDVRLEFACSNRSILAVVKKVARIEGDPEPKGYVLHATKTVY